MARGKEREAAILAAAIRLLEEVGYEAMTMDEVAEKAKASKATIYRRWRSKAQLVKAALDELDAGQNALVPDTGALRSDLVAVMQGIRRKATPAHVAMLHGVALAARRDQELAGLLQLHMDDETLSPFHAVLERAVERRWLPSNPPMALIHDVAEAMILRQLQIGSPFDRAFIHRVVDQVLLPLLGRKGK